MSRILGEWCVCVTCGIGAETLGRDTKEETEEEPRFRATVAHDVGVHFGSGFYDINEDRAIGSYAQQSLGKLAVYTWAQDQFKEAAATWSHGSWWFPGNTFRAGHRHVAETGTPRFGGHRSFWEQRKMFCRS